MHTVANLAPTKQILTQILGYRETGKYINSGSHDEVTVFETGEGGNGAELHVIVRADLPRERAGRGSVHHVAFRVESEEELRKWVTRLKQNRIPNSGFVERYYFRSLYFREPNGILFELALSLIHI